ncbi:transcription elongation factor GreA [Ehrlichia ruminantium]|uniref:Transcription elongation factor GreA n=1 Tax=Ehrlichia ruminantium (strain Welgevonden) TaxID=254945 RepID=A0A0H3M7H3_EHRRW|nr:transcription elongation factor GreA [Ehrlichia ruminantium]QLK54754.1 transcription elongation factor GreA [Ehrlichia ruminantium]QLK55674.1 transcription elongation factor GreA [Ehrlichia ruminantium]QLK57501.1 transcription elongation factor GreA [Ehrlichia ruminantium]QLK58419.1 transcription elongation factor GreA [Ehrlichia ruminantium]UOD98866.1 transcription elongation factor GreA [Ehrlichia ruminantium]
MNDYMNERFPITKAGFEKLELELESLKYERPQIIKSISEARELGDLSENAEYHAARERQGLVESKIMELESKKSRAEVIDVANLSGDTVMFGATVTMSIYDEQTGSTDEVIYQIVGEYESDISKRMISIKSPLVISLLGKKEGDVVEVKTPKGDYRIYKIIKIEFI